METKVRSSQKAEALNLEIEFYFVPTYLQSLAPVMRNPRASRASTVRHASLPQPLLAPDSVNTKEFYFIEQKILFMSLYMKHFDEARPGVIKICNTTTTWFH